MYALGIPLALLALLVVVTIFINQVERVPLVVREGQTFEKGIVTEILQDNLQPDGSRTGEQVVMVHMTTGVRAGQEMRTTSSSGYLFGAGCTVGMKVVVLQSVAGESIITTVYAQDRGGVIYLFAALYLLVLCLVGGSRGSKVRWDWYSPSCVFSLCTCRWSIGAFRPSGWRCWCV